MKPTNPETEIPVINSTNLCNENPDQDITINNTDSSIRAFIKDIFSKIADIFLKFICCSSQNMDIDHHNVVDRTSHKNTTVVTIATTGGEIDVPIEYKNGDINVQLVPGGFAPNPNYNSKDGQ